MMEPSGSVYYEVNGPKDAIAVVFTHGFALDHETWLGQIETLSETYRTLAWDVPGCGDAVQASEPVRFDVASQRLLDVLDEEGIDEAVFVGQSMGTLLNQYIAYHNPDRVRALVHVGGFPLHEGFSDRALTMMRLHIRLLELMPAKSIYKMFGRMVARTPDAQEYVREVSARTGKENMVALERALLEDIKKRIPEPLANHRHLIVVGEHEYDLLRKKSISWSDRLPDSEFERVPEAGHLANHDNPTAFNEILGSFLESSNQFRTTEADGT